MTGEGFGEGQPPQGDNIIDPDNIVFRDVSDMVAPGSTVGDVLESLGANPDEFDFMVGSADTILGALDEPIRSTNEQDSRLSRPHDGRNGYSLSWSRSEQVNDEPT
jgi:hypothetical protein